MKNTLAKSTQIRPTKKFNTSIKNFDTAKKSQQVHASQNKMKTSITKGNNTNRSSNPLSGSSKVRKSISSTTKKKTVNTKNIQDNKKKSIMKKPETATVRKNDKKSKTSVGIKNNTSTKRNSMSVSLKKDNINKAKHKSVQLKNVNLFNSSKNKSKSKTAKKKAMEIYDIDEEEKISSKESQNNKDLRNSEAFNKNESVGINIMNNINDEEENNLDRNNIILENDNEKNLTANKLNNNQMNSPLQNELIKEKIASEFIKANIINVDSEHRLKNKMVETSNYISDKNKNMMRGLLYLLDKKPEESKNQKNIFRASINSLDKKEKNKLIDVKYQNRKKLYKEKLGNDIKKINSINSLNEKNSLNVIHEEKKVDSPPKETSPFLPINLEDKYQTMKNKYLVMITPSNPKKQYPIFYKDKYFVDYVNGRCPNRDFFERTMKYEKNIYDFNNINDGISEDNYKFNLSYNNKFQFKEKNDLFVDKRDNRYTQYNYGSMIYKINDKLDGFNTDRYFRHTFHSFHKNNSDFGLNSRDSERNQRVSKLYNDINNNINSVSSPEYQQRKTYSERNPFL